MEERPSPKARCWVDAENADWCPEAMELHLATEAVYDQSQVFEVSKCRIEVRGGKRSRRGARAQVWGSET